MSRTSLAVSAAILAAAVAFASHAQSQPKGAEKMKAAPQETKGPAFMKIDNIRGDSTDQPKPPPPPPPSKK